MRANFDEDSRPSSLTKRTLSANSCADGTAPNFKTVKNKGFFILKKYKNLFFLKRLFQFQIQMRINLELALKLMREESRIE